MDISDIIGMVMGDRMQLQRSMAFSDILRTVMGDRMQLWCSMDFDGIYENGYER